LTSDILVIPRRKGEWHNINYSTPLQRHSWRIDNPYFSRLWNRLYEGIEEVNRVLVQLRRAPSGTVDPAPYLAELKVLRAFYHYLLMDNFGNIPIVDSYESPANIRQANRTEVFSFVKQQLLANVEKLPTQLNHTTRGRFHRWAGKGLLATLFLNAEIYTDTPHYQEVVRLIDEIIDSGRFSLEEDYQSPFASDNNTSKEIIFAVPYDNTHAPHFSIHLNTLHQLNQRTYNLATKPWNEIGAQPHFIESYDTEDTRLELTWLSGVQYSADGDTLRLPSGEPLVFKNEMQDLQLASSNALYRIKKYEIPSGAGIRLSNDLPVIRYADLLLMKAEALLRSGENISAAADLVNQVRSRAFGPLSEEQKTTGSEQQQTIELYGVQVPYGRLLMERGWELAAEPDRRRDLIRFGVFTKGEWGPAKKTSEAYRTLFPIPPTALQQNPNLKQNPGY
jgi:hypothetical protein